jgi:hypothetical protein
MVVSVDQQDRRADLNHRKPGARPRASAPLPHAALMR